MTRILYNRTDDSGLAVLGVDVTVTRIVQLVVPNLLAAPGDLADCATACQLAFVNGDGTLIERRT